MTYALFDTEMVRVWTGPGETASGGPRGGGRFRTKGPPLSSGHIRTVGHEIQRRGNRLQTSRPSGLRPAGAALLTGRVIVSWLSGNLSPAVSLFLIECCLLTIWPPPLLLLYSISPCLLLLNAISPSLLSSPSVSTSLSLSRSGDVVHISFPSSLWDCLDPP